jgi:threonylcarbamoyladenosine tRNA methylthiotransferase MtaB
MKYKISLSENSKSKVITFGCRLNHSESKTIEKHLQNLKIKNTFVINTCAVTSESERQVKQTIRKIRKTHPNTYIIATGCSVQIDPNYYNSMKEVDEVILNNNKTHIDNYKLHTTNYFTENKLITKSINLQNTAKQNSLTKSFIEVQNGCNHRCSFCTIPFGRGNNKSVMLKDLYYRIKSTILEGSKEIIMTGVDITEYGNDFKINYSIEKMIKNILRKVDSLTRLRISSIDPAGVDNKLICLLEAENRIAPYFHLSIQSGDNTILKRMKRRHLRKDIIFICEHIRKSKKNIILGADFITGFPTESCTMFKNTIKIIKKCSLTHLHIFPFSVRNNTSASRMPQNDKNTIKERSTKLRALSSIQVKKLLTSYTRKVISVLIEENNFGYCELYIKVRLISNKYLEKGSIVRGKILSCNLKKKFLLAIVIED